MRLKNNKASGTDDLPGEFFKTEGEMLIGHMHQLLCKIWLLESKVKFVQYSRKETPRDAKTIEESA